jgi:hypothetical protein
MCRCLLELLEHELIRSGKLEINGFILEITGRNGGITFFNEDQWGDLR